MLFVMNLVGCDQTEKNKNTHKTKTVVAKLQAPIQKLYFTGMLSPLSTTAVISPVDGTVTKTFFTYGEKIAQNQPLFMIDSNPLSERYRKTVSDFFQKKQAYANGKVSFAGTNALYDAGVIPQSQYASEKTTFDTTALNYLQARYELEKVLKIANADPQQIEKLSLENTAAVNAILQRHFSHIMITAPGAGIALFPPKENNDNHDTNTTGKLTEGSAVKEGQLLLSIGDLSGLSATFYVSEVNIDRLDPNMPVIVTGSAFPDITLHGMISTVSAQARQDSNDSSGLSTYAVSVRIPSVSRDEMKKIRVGMTAKFEIDIALSQHILVPINAVFQKDEKRFVRVIQKNGTEKTVLVETGDTTPTQVMITKGLQPGDQVITHD